MFVNLITVQMNVNNEATSDHTDGRDLPDSWCRVRLGDVCEKAHLVNPTAQPQRPFVYIDVSSVSNETFTIVEEKVILGKDAPGRARKGVRANDVIVATVRPTLRRIAMIPGRLDGQVASTGYCVVRPDKAKAASMYIYFCLLTESVAKRVEALQAGATYPAITDADVYSLSIPLPPLAEQRAIAHALRAVQEAIQARRRELALERERKAALMEQLFTKGTCGEPTRQTELGEVPESWQVVQFSDVIDIVGGQVDPRREPFASMIHVGPENIEQGTGRLLAGKTARELNLISGKYLFTPDHVLYSKIRPYLRKAALPTFQGICSADMYPLTPKMSHYLLREFLFYILFTERFTAQATASQDRTGIPKINRDQLGRVWIPLPTTSEQADIASVLGRCDAKSESLERESTLLEELFRAMLEELMTGCLSAIPLIETDETGAS